MNNISALTKALRDLNSCRTKIRFATEVLSSHLPDRDTRHPDGLRRRWQRFELRDRQLVAIDIASNRVLWRFTGNGELFSAPFTVNDTVFVAALDGQLFAVDGATGAAGWQYKAETKVYDTWEIDALVLPGMASSGGVLVVPTGDVLSAFRLQPK